MNESRPNETALEPATYAPGRTTIWNNSWRRIYDHFNQAILAYARRGGLNEHSAEDVLQEVMMTLIRCQHGQEPGFDRAAGTTFQAWLWGVIRNRVRAVRRKDTKEMAASPLRTGDTQGPASPSLPEVPQEPEDFAQREDKHWQHALLAAALSKVRERVSKENFAIYTALLEEKANAEELAEKFGKKANAIYAVKHRCEEMLLVEARRLKAAWADLRHL